VASCDGDRHIQAGVPSPVNSPNGGGKRRIPDRGCIEQFLLVPPGERSNYGELRESWETHSQVRRPDGHTLASFDPYFQVFFPSRYYDPTQPGDVGRPIAACYEVQPNGDRAQGGECAESTGEGALDGLAYDDARSLFNGVLRQVDINGNTIRNGSGPDVWYTDPMGRNARTEPFPGSIRQFIAHIDNTGRVPHGPHIGRTRDHGGPGVHAPN
jgi:hypothetical protein